MFEIWGSAFIIVTGCLGHFIYDWTNHNRTAAVFFAVNESTWEHIKLTIYPSLLWFVAAAMKYQGISNLIEAQFCSMAVMILLIPLFFYGYTLFTKKNYLIVDILCFCLSVCLGMYVFNRIIYSEAYCNIFFDAVAVLGIMAIVTMYFMFTFNPPINFLFKDPITKKYGLSGHPCMHDHSQTHNGDRHLMVFRREEPTSPALSANLEFLRKCNKVYFVAMESELDKDCTSSEVVFTGVGKARATRALINYIRNNRELMESKNAPVIVSIGTAGSGKHSKGDIILCEKFVNNGDSFVKETLEFNTFPEPTSTICASSDFFVSEYNFKAGEVSSMREAYDCLEMESFALANICKTYGLKFCAVKCISDGANDTVANFEAELPKFRTILNEFVKKIDK